MLFLAAVYDGSADVSLVDLQTELEEKLQLKENVFSQEDARSVTVTIDHNCLLCGHLFYKIFA